MPEQSGALAPGPGGHVTLAYGVRTGDLYSSVTQAAALAGCIEQRRYPAGSNIICQGEPADTFYVLIRGTYQVLCNTPGGGEGKLLPMPWRNDSWFTAGSRSF